MMMIRFPLLKPLQEPRGRLIIPLKVNKIMSSEEINDGAKEVGIKNKEVGEMVVVRKLVRNVAEEEEGIEEGVVDDIGRNDVGEIVVGEVEGDKGGTS
ncbi:hypothetical protein ACLOJK_026575 [Asimina triloba]